MTGWTALACPQCSAPLPRVAIWRSVKCASCGSLIIRNESVVTRDSFRQAFARARQGSGGALREIRCGGRSFELLQSLGVGEISHVYLARRAGALPVLATVKLSSAAPAVRRYAREAQVLRELQALDGHGAAYFSQRLPEVLAEGVVEDTTSERALVLRHPNGFWGNLAELQERFPKGIDPRHVVWIWRRMLEVLAFIHRHGWSHGDVRPEHALVHPEDHGIRLISWGSAEKNAGASAQAADLRRSARIALALLNGARESDQPESGVPAPLAELVVQASHDDAFCATHRADGLDHQLRDAAKAAFGPPAFVPLTL